jgi:hypothetical protein
MFIARFMRHDDVFVRHLHSVYPSDCDVFGWVDIVSRFALHDNHVASFLGLLSGMYNSYSLVAMPTLCANGRVRLKCVNKFYWRVQSIPLPIRTSSLT